MSNCSNSIEGEDDKPSNELIGKLKANKWIARDASFGIGKNDHAWADIESTTLYFTTNDMGVVYWLQKDYDTDLGNSHNIEYNNFSYTVSGNNITTTMGSFTSNLTYTDSYLIDGDIIYQSYPMDSGDYELLKQIAPKSGSCGDKLTYTYTPKTHQLTISGSGQMNDYTSTNQPWHNYYIEEVVIEEGCTSVGKNAFTNIQHITGIDLPSTLKIINDKAFAGTMITEITLPKNVTVIGKEAFAGCDYLKKVYLNDNLEEIGDFAFSGTIKSTYLTMPKNLKTIGNNAFSGWIIDNLTLNEKLETIGDGAFSGVKGTINIPNSVKSIGYIAFAGTFNKVIIGTGLEHLKKDAFTSSASTGSFYVNLGVPLEMDGYIFCGNMVDYDIQNKWTLYVPKGSKNAYKEKIYWNKFKSIIEDNTLISGNGTPSDDNDNGNDENGNQVGKDEKEQNAIDAKDKRRGYVSSSFSGHGTKASPYLIRNAADLRLLSDKCRDGNTYRDEYFKQTSDIVINSNVINSQGECNPSDEFERWIPIGCLENSPFCGTYDGNGHSINGIFISRKVCGSVGLFGYFAGNIHNLAIKDSYIESRGNAAGFAGNASYFNEYIPQLESCINYAVVKGGSHTGGIVGRGKSCKILKSKNYGNIGEVRASYAGDATLILYGGGIAGWIYGGGHAIIQDCVNYGNLNINKSKSIEGCLGGIAAILGSTRGVAYINNCINKGCVSDTKGAISGITQIFYKGGTISNCVNIGHVLVDGNKGCPTFPNRKGEKYMGGKYSNIFYLETTGTGLGTSMTENQIKDSSFIKKLNTNAKALNGSLWITDNDGFPTLKL